MSQVSLQTSIIQTPCIYIVTPVKDTRLGVVAAHAELQHLVKAAALGEQAAQAPERAAAKRGAAHTRELPFPRHLYHADAAANVDQQVREQVRVRCARHKPAQISVVINYVVIMSEVMERASIAFALASITSPFVCLEHQSPLR